MNQEMELRIRRVTDARKTAKACQGKLDKLRGDHIHPFVLGVSALSQTEVNLPPERALKIIIDRDVSEPIQAAANTLLESHKELASAARESWRVVQPLEKEIEAELETISGAFAIDGAGRQQAIIDRFVPLLLPVCNNDHKEAERFARQLPRIKSLEFQMNTQISPCIVRDAVARLKLILRLREELEASEAADLGLTTPKKSK